MESSSKKGRTIHSEAREVIRKFIKACDEEARAGRIEYSVKQAKLRVSKYTEVSMKSISRIRKGKCQSWGKFIVNAMKTQETSRIKKCAV
jgi:hypothetical protein